MADQKQIRNALMSVMDPELGKNIVEAGMVRNIHIDQQQNVIITLALTMKGCPLKDQLQRETIEAAQSVAGVSQVTVELTTMTPEEKQKLMGDSSPAKNLNQIGQIIAVMSGKGGVGKSSMTALLAVALRRQGYEVGIMDADLTGPSIPRMFGVTGPVPGLPLGILPIKSETGIKVMSTNLMLPEEDMALLWRGPIMSKTIRQFWGDVIWGRVDYLLIDLPPGTSDATISVMQSIPLNGVLMVTTPQSLASMVVRKTVHMAQGLEVPILGIVENMSYYPCPDSGNKHYIFGESHTHQIEELANAPLLGKLPIDPELVALADEGAIEKYESPFYQELAEAFIQAAPRIDPTPVMQMSSN